MQKQENEKQMVHSRILKFRAWDKEKKIMVMDVQDFYDTLGKHYDGNGNEIDLYEDSSLWEHNSFGSILADEENPVMQYTGLKDKNGKEIYEGDIVKGVFNFGHGEWKMLGEVFYDHSGFRFKLIEGDENREGLVNYFDFIEDDGTIFSKMEVMGNIYEQTLDKVSR